MRLYAMYARSRKILALLVLLVSCEICALAVLFGYPKKGLIGKWTTTHPIYKITNFPCKPPITPLRASSFAQMVIHLANTGLATTGPPFYVSSSSSCYCHSTKLGCIEMLVVGWWGPSQRARLFTLCSSGGFTSVTKSCGCVIGQVRVVVIHPSLDN